MGSTSSSQKTSTSRRSRSSRPAVRVDWPTRFIRIAMAVAFLGIFYYFFIRPYVHRWRYVPGQDGYGVYIPSGYSVYGIDISRYQKNIDWAQVVDNQNSGYPIRFVFIKATEGRDFQDRLFQENFRNARRYGFIRGAYHFYIPSVPPQEQARNFIRTVPLQAGDLPPVLDVEKQGGKEREALKKDVKEWLKIVEKHYGTKPIIYASWKFKEAYLKDEELDQYPFWIAHYYVDSVKYKGNWSFWQYTDLATIPGISSSVDMNIFRGTLEELTDLTLK